jgi:hypothetical protein
VPIEAQRAHHLGKHVGRPVGAVVEGMEFVGQLGQQFQGDRRITVLGSYDRLE